MRKLIILITVLIANSLLFCNNYSDLPKEIVTIKKRGYLVVSMYYKDIKPFMFHDVNGNFVGHDVELAQNIAKQLGVECRFNRSPKTFNEIVDLVALGEADMAISLLSRTLDRALKVRFSKPYIFLRPTILISRLSASRFNINLRDPIKSLSGIKLEIAEKSGTSYIGKALSFFPGSNVTGYDEWEEAIDAVLDINNPADIVIRDEIGIRNYIAEFPEKSIKLQMVTLEEEKYKDPLAIAVHRDSIHLQEWLNIYFDQFGIIGNADNLLKKYEN